MRRAAVIRSRTTPLARSALQLVALALTLWLPAAQTARGLDFVAVTFNVGTTEALAHDADPNDGYTSTEAAISDAWYGNGLAWPPAIDAVASFFAALEPEVVALQEVFHSPDCAQIPATYHAGFDCEDWQPGSPTVAEQILGPSYQIACHLGKPDKCLAVHEDFGHFTGCSSSLCLDTLDGATVAGCGLGSRVGRGTIELVGGGTLTVIGVHATSGIADADRACRVEQFRQVFEDLDGEPAANGEVNLVLADLNIDPARWIGFDPSANLLDVHAPVLGGGDFEYVSEVGFEALPTYLGYFNLDHQLSDALIGSCTTPGIGGAPPVLAATYFDHVPIVCSVPEPGLAAAILAGASVLTIRARARRPVRAAIGTRRDEAPRPEPTQKR